MSRKGIVKTRITLKVVKTTYFQWGPEYCRKKNDQ